MSEVVEATTMEQQVDTIVDRYGANKQFSLAILQDTQKTYNYLPREVLEHIAKRLDISLGEVYRLATFFAAFSLQSGPDHSRGQVLVRGGTLRRRLCPGARLAGE